MRDVRLKPPLGGWNIVDSRARIGEAFLSIAENVVVTTKALKRRLGKAAAYAPMVTSAHDIGFLHRFYNLGTTGPVSKQVIASASTVIYRIPDSSDWDDSAGTLVTTAWTAMSLPNTTDDTLHSSQGTQIISSTGWQSPVETNSWLYIAPKYVAFDDDNVDINVPIRTQGSGTETFLHGLVPPNPLVVADTEDSSSGTMPSWTSLELVDAGGGSNDVGIGLSIAVDSELSIHIAYQDDTAGSLLYATRDVNDTSWTVTNIYTATAPKTGSIEIVADTEDNLHVCFIIDAGGGGADDVKYATKHKGSTTWTIEDVDTTSDFLVASMVLDSKNDPHIVYTDISGGVTDGDLIHSTKVGGGSWTRTVIDDFSVTGRAANWCSVAVDSADDLHCSYHDSTGTQLMYAKRTSGTWGGIAVVDTVAANTGDQSSIAVNSSDVPAIAYWEQTAGDVRYADRTGGTWAITEDVESAVGASGFGFGQKALRFDANDVACLVYYEPTNDVLRFGKRISGTWNIETITTSHDVGLHRSMFIDKDGDFHVAYFDETNDQLRYAFGDIQSYYYKLTAEYDDLVLGESGPSSAFGVSLPNDISTQNTHTLDLNAPASGATRYNMTTEVTRLNVWRTVRGSSSDGTYYKAGFVECSSGVPDADFTDDVKDIDLVANDVLDEDKYLPPKYKTSVFWKDRLVIGNLKCRDIDDPQDETLLDYEGGGIHKNRIRFSEANFPDLFRLGFWQDILPDTDSGSIQKLIVNKATDALYVFMEDDVVALTDQRGDLVSSLSFVPRTVVAGDGTPAPKSVVYHDGRIFYFTKHGIRAIEGLGSREITTHTVSALWNTLDTAHPAYAERINMAQIGLVSAGVSKERGWERIYFAYPSASSTYNDRVLSLHYDVWKSRGFRGDPPFTLHKNIRAATFMRWDGEGDRGELFCGEANSALYPWVYRLDFGNSEIDGTASASTTSTSALTSVVEVGQTDAGIPDMLKAWQDSRVTMKAGTPLTGPSTQVQWNVAFDETASTVTLDTFTWPDDAATPTYPRREVRRLPRAAIATYAGLKLTMTDIPGSGEYPAPWELYSMGFTVRDIRSRHRGERNT